METVCQVNLNIMSRREAIRAEKVIRDYLLRTADEVSMRMVPGSLFSLSSLIPHPMRRKRFQRMLKDGDVLSVADKTMVFRLTENIKQLLNQSTLLFDGSGSVFYRLTDPKFSKQGREIATIVSNEGIINLYIPDSDKAQLADQGVYMDSPIM